MFDLKSDLNLCNRLEVGSTLAVSGNSAGKHGRCVNFSDGSIGTATSGKGAFMVGSESNRDNSFGWTPDVNDTGNLTVLAGHYIGYTTEFDETAGDFAIGDLLVVGADGKLVEATVAADETDTQASAVAVCLGASADHKYVGGTYESIKIMSL